MAQTFSIFALTKLFFMIQAFDHKLSNGEKVRFSIWSSARKEGYYYAKVIAVYKTPPEADEKPRYGVIVRDNQKIVYYKDPQKLRTDLLANYGIRQLKSEI